MFGLSAETQALLIILLVFTILLIVFIRTMLNINKGRSGGGFISMMGATYELHTKDRQSSIQEI